MYIHIMCLIFEPSNCQQAIIEENFAATVILLKNL